MGEHVALTLTGTELLAITTPEGLFPADDVDAKALYRQLSRRWHPDVVGGREPVFAHLTKLYRDRKDKLAAGTWGAAGAVRITMQSGKEYLIHQLASAPFELGQSLVTEKSVIYLVDPDHVPRAQHALEAIKLFQFPNDRVKAEIARYLPMVMSPTLLADGRMMVQIPKTPDCIRLRDVVTHQGHLDVRHTAWVVSSLLNLCCYLTIRGIVHHDISPDTYFVSPLYHSGALLGGWWYWALSGDPITTVPRRTFDVMPFKAKSKKRASRHTDLELVRATALEILHDGPAPMRKWLETPGTGSAIQQYKEWMDVVLPASFGPRKFVKLDITQEQVYGKAGTVHG